MSKIKLTFQKLLEATRKNIFNSKDYESLLICADKELAEMLRIIGYRAKTFETLTQSAAKENRYKRLLARKNSIVHNPERCISDYVRYARKKIDKFLIANNLGRASEMYLNPVNTSFTITLRPEYTGFGSEQKREKMLNVIRKMKSEGFVFEGNGKKARYSLIDNDQNKLLINKILEDNGARFIYYESRKGSIRSVSFKLDPCDIDMMEVTSSEQEDAHKPEEIANKLKNIIAAIDFIENTDCDKNDCAFVLENDFASVCKMLNFKGIISENVRKRTEENIENNKLYEKISYEIGETISKMNRENPSIVKNAVAKINWSIRRFGYEKMNSYINDFKIDQYGFAKADFVWQESVDEADCVVEDFELEKLDIVPVSIKERETAFELKNDDNDTLYLLNNERNMETVESVMKEIDGEPYEFTTCKRGNASIGSFYSITRCAVYIEDVEKIATMY